jgi:hypothetical protein
MLDRFSDILYLGSLMVNELFPVDTFDNQIDTSRT